MPHVSSNGLFNRIEVHKQWPGRITKIKLQFFPRRVAITVLFGFDCLNHCIMKKYSLLMRRYSKTYFHLSSDQYIQGFEVPFLVLFTTNLEGSHNERVLSRCMTELVVICSGNSVQRLFKAVQHSDQFCIKIDISGKH